MKIDKERAEALLREEASLSETKPIDAAWEQRFEELSRLCEIGISKTHIAFLGTAILAKAMDRGADLYAIKPNLDPENPNAYSARTLCHGVLVPLSAELKFDIGVGGREPLNNQPYFRMTKLGDETPVHVGGRDAFKYMLTLVGVLHDLKDEASARIALRAFIKVRKQYQRTYSASSGEVRVAPEHLAMIISDFVGADSEGGKRAQAVVAGMLDVYAGVERVECGRINDPSRHFPGDVGIRFSDDTERFEKSFEVRDKPVNVSDIQVFGRRCVQMGVRETAVVMAAEAQQGLNEAQLSKWATSMGIGVTLFNGWPAFVDQVLFWSKLPKPEAVTVAVERIEKRLIAIEASTNGVELWQSLTRP